MASESISRTWDVTHDVAARVRQWADRMGVWDSDLVNALLTHALAELDAGRLALDRQPVLYQVAGVKQRRRA